MVPELVQDFHLSRIVHALPEMVVAERVELSGFGDPGQRVELEDGAVVGEVIADLFIHDEKPAVDVTGLAVGLFPEAGDRVAGKAQFAEATAGPDRSATGWTSSAGARSRRGA